MCHIPMMRFEFGLKKSTCQNSLLGVEGQIPINLWSQIYHKFSLQKTIAFGQAVEGDTYWGSVIRSELVAKAGV